MKKIKTITIFIIGQSLAKLCGKSTFGEEGKGNGSSYQKLSDSQLSFPRRAVSKTSQKIIQLSQNAFKGNTISFVRQK